MDGLSQTCPFQPYPGIMKSTLAHTPTLRTSKLGLGIVARCIRAERVVMRNMQSRWSTSRNSVIQIWKCSEMKLRSSASWTIRMWFGARRIQDQRSLLHHDGILFCGNLLYHGRFQWSLGRVNNEWKQKIKIIIANLIYPWWVRARNLNPINHFSRTEENFFSFRHKRNEKLDLDNLEISKFNQHNSFLMDLKAIPFNEAFRKRPQTTLINK